MATKNNPGAYDCYDKAEGDEPLFVLLARDKYAPTLIWLWATLRELDDEKAEKVKEARETALDMIAWAHARKRNVAGLGVATMAGCVEMVRTVNGLLAEARERGERPDSARNDATSDETIRRFLCATEFEGGTDNPA